MAECHQLNWPLHCSLIGSSCRASGLLDLLCLSIRGYNPLRPAEEESRRSDAELTALKIRMSAVAIKPRLEFLCGPGVAVEVPDRTRGERG